MYHTIYVSDVCIHSYVVFICGCDVSSLKAADVDVNVKL